MKWITAVTWMFVASTSVDAQMSVSEVLTMGPGSGEAAHQFDGVTDAVRLSNGTIVLALRSELRLFGPDGKLIKSIGGASAPTELREIDHLIVLPADSIAVFSSRARARLVFTHNGDFVRATPVAILANRRDLPIRGSGNGEMRTERVLPGGQIVGHYGEYADGRYYPEVLQYLLVTSDTAVPLVELPAQPRATITVRGMEDTERVIFGAYPVLAATSTRVFIGHTGDSEIRAFQLDGTPSTPIRVEVRRREIGRDDLRRYIAAEARSVPEAARERFAERLQAAAVAAELPLYGHLFGTSDGMLWVSDYSTDQTKPRRWVIYDEGGVRSGEVMLPSAFTPLHAHGEHVLGVLRDEQGAQHVRLYRISNRP